MRLATLLPFLVLLFLAGCRPDTTALGGKSREKDYRAIVSLSPNVTELIAQYGPMDKLRGRTEACNYPSYIATQQSIQVVASVKPNYEKIRSINPDLIIYDSAVYNENDVAKLKELGIVLYEFKADSLEEFKTSLYRLAAKIGGETKMSDYVDKITAESAEATEAASGAKLKTAVLMGGAGGEFMILGKNSFQADVLRTAGADVVGPEADEFVPLGAEALVSWNPDVILLADRTGIDAYAEMADSDTEKLNRKDGVLARAVPESVVKDPRFASTKAVRNKRIASVNPDVLLRKGARVDKLIDGVSRYLMSIQN